VNDDAGEEPTEAQTYPERLRRTRQKLDDMFAAGWTVREVVEHIDSVIAAGEGMYAQYNPPFYLETLRAERKRLLGTLS